jgi:hypothetical protein
MALNVDAVTSEITGVAGALSLTWAEFSAYLKGKMMEAAVNGGVTSYTVNGRTVAKDLRWWQEAHQYALAQSNIETSGGVDIQPIYFGKRV